jgi:acyl-CoA thioesterase
MPGASSPSDTAFARDTAVRPVHAGAYAAQVSPEWRAGRGPHGGYLAAIVLRALCDTVGDAQRAPRSLTIHHTRAPDPGPLVVRTATERRGRSLSAASARVEQDGALMALAVGAFSAPRPGPELGQLAPPEVAPADLRPDRPTPPVEGVPRFIQHLVMQPRLGPPPFTGAAAPMETGGWLGLYEPQPVDAPVAALFCDAWWSPPFVCLERPALSPTIDLTIHFRRPLPVEHSDPADLCLARFRTGLVHDGFFDNDAVLWGPDGTVLAQARQLALLIAD